MLLCKNIWSSYRSCPGHRYRRNLRPSSRRGDELKMGPGTISTVSRKVVDGSLGRGWSSAGRVAAAGGGMVELEPSKHVTWIFVLLWTAAAARTRPWLSSQLAAAGCRVQPAEPTGTLQRTLAPSKHSLVTGVSNMDCSVAI